MPTHHTTTPAPPRRRADAERSIARILDAAVDALASDTEASTAEIARRAGVVRATIYVHFPTREALLEAVPQRAMAEVVQVIEAAEPRRGDPAEALARVVAASWHMLGRYHALVAINTRQHWQAELRQRHSSVLSTLEPLIELGQADGTFCADVPAAWHLSMLMELMHAASAELGAGRVSDIEAGPALVATILGAVTARHATDDSGNGPRRRAFRTAPSERRT
jgi:TetR/AcrR family transcriptional repressor of mexCD-oprJ operon